MVAARAGVTPKTLNSNISMSTIIEHARVNP
jgi:hypothetical protein